jgi:hypothetical protein
MSQNQIARPTKSTKPSLLVEATNTARAANDRLAEIQAIAGDLLENVQRLRHEVARVGCASVDQGRASFLLEALQRTDAAAFQALKLVKLSGPVVSQ